MRRLIVFNICFVLLSCTHPTPQESSQQDFQTCYDSQVARDPASGRCLPLLLGELSTERPALPYDYKTNGVYDYQTLTQFYLSKYPERYAEPFVDTQLEFLRFVRYDFYQARKNKMHGTQMFGVEAYRSWRRADSYLNSIPVGKLKLSIELFSTVHRMATEGVHRWLKVLDPFLPDGFLPDEGGLIKKRTNVGKFALFQPIDEATYNVLKSNSWLGKGGFKELPYPLSRPGKRRGLILYKEPEKTIEALQELISWYNSHKEKMDPAELAARFQYRFVSIHPFIDGNGRVSRLFMDRILKELNLPPSIMENLDRDILLTEDAWVQHVQRGVKKGAEILEEVSVVDPMQVTLNHLKPKSILNLPLNIFNTTIINTKTDSFKLENDGLFYNIRAIPHAFHNGTFYPIPDRTLQLILNDYSQKNRYADSMNKSTYKLSESYRDILRTHFKLLRDIESKKVDPDQLKVESYDNIAQANELGKFQFHTWNEKTLVDFLTNNDLRKEPFLTLVPSTQALRYSRKNSLSFIIANYERVDLLYWELQQAIKIKFPHLEELVVKRRVELHSYARGRLQRILQKSTAKDLAKKHPLYQIYEQYMANSKLSFESYQQAIETLGDSHIYLFRSDQIFPRFIGFRSQTEYQSLFKKLPGAKMIEELVREVLTKVKSSPKVSGEWEKSIKDFKDNYIKKIAPKKYYELIDAVGSNIIAQLEGLNRVLFRTRYEDRSVLPELERQYVDFFYHSRGDTLKTDISFSSNLGMYVTNGSLPFTGHTMSLGTLYLLKIDKEKTSFNYVSNFIDEFEFLVRDKLGPSSVVKSVTVNEIKKADNFAEVRSFLTDTRSN